MDDITIKSGELPFAPAIFYKESSLNNEKINQEVFVGFDDEKNLELFSDNAHLLDNARLLELTSDYAHLDSSYRRIPLKDILNEEKYEELNTLVQKNVYALEVEKKLEGNPFTMKLNDGDFSDKESLNKLYELDLLGIELKNLSNSIETNEFDYNYESHVDLETGQISKNQMLGSVIYEHDNPKQQVLLVQDLKNNDRKEYPIDKNMDIRKGSQKQSLNNILSDKNKKELNTAIRHNTTTSFMLSKNEMAKVNNTLLTNKRFNENVEEKESMMQLKNQYKTYQELLRTESKGELTEDKVINRMNAENQYRNMKQDAIDKNPDVSKSIEKMERNVKAQQKNKSNDLSM